MAYELKPGQGSLFKNEDKKTDKHPAYKGKLKTPSGEFLYVALWQKKTKNGETWLSLAVEEPRKKEPEPQGGGSFDLDDSIPFAPQVD